MMNAEKNQLDVLDAALDDGAEKDDGIGYPDDGDEEVDGPLELGVFLGGRDPQR